MLEFKQKIDDYKESETCYRIECIENKEGKAAISYQRDVARAKKLMNELREQEGEDIPTTMEELKEDRWTSRKLEPCL